MNKELFKSQSFQEFIKSEDFSSEVDINSIMGIVYRATNIVNGKVYIGISVVSMEVRRKSHEKTPAYHFQKSIKKYGKENFIWEVIDFFCSKEEAKEKEIFWIWLNNSRDVNLGYNITPGGQWGDTMSCHPDKEAIVQKNIETHLRNNSYKKGKDSCKYGKNDHCFGLINYAKLRKGKSNIEFYGEEKAAQIENSRKLSIEKRKQLGIKIKHKEGIKVSDNLLKFILSYAYYDITVESFYILFSIFKTKDKTIGVLRDRTRKRFPEEYKELNKVFKSRICKGERNPRFGAKLSEETRQKISKATMGRKAYNKTFRTKEELNNLIDTYFEYKDVTILCGIFKLSDTSIRTYLKKLGIKYFKKSARIKKLNYFSTNNKEDFYVK